MNGLHFLKTEKFTTNTIGVLIRSSLTKESATKNALLCEVLKYACAKYSTHQSLVMQAESLYGCAFDSYIIKKGGEQILFFYAEVIKKPNDALLLEGLDFLYEIIFNPLVKEEHFDEAIVAFQKKTLMKKLQSQKDDKKAFAAKRCMEEMFENTPYGISADGYEEDIGQIDAKNLYAHYKSLLQQAVVEMILTGGTKTAQIEQKAMQFLKSNNPPIPLRSIALEKKEIKSLQETAQISQCRLCIGVSSSILPNQTEIYHLLLFNEVLGGNPSSRLFANVREKEGLCYYVNSYVNSFQSSIFIQAGIEHSKFKKTVDLITKTMNELADNGVTEDELTNAKKSLNQYYLSLKDQQTGIMDFYFNELLRTTNHTVEEIIALLNDATAEDMKKTAQTLNISTIYFLTDDKEEKNGDN